MDFESLFEILPKEPCKWSAEDVTSWLSFIHLPMLTATFSQSAIDGSCLQSLQPSDLDQQLGIRSNIAKKKLMKWIQNGLALYEQFVADKKKFSLESRLPEEIGFKRVHTSIQRDRVNTAYQQHVSAFELPAQPRELFVTPYEGQNASFFSIGPKGSRIGKHPSNGILVHEVSIIVTQESVEVYHAELTYHNDFYYLTDLGSRHGTFLKIKDKQQLTPGMVIQMGSYLFTILDCDSTTLKLLYSCQQPQPPKQITLTFTPTKSSFTIGRKSTADLYLQDQHLSGIHSRISTLHRHIIIQDMSSTNGTWIRLSKPLEKSQAIMIEDRMVFKVGNTSTYTCRYRQKMEIEEVENKKKGSNKGRCLGCNKEHLDGLLNPCKHNVCCFECSRKVRDCPVCGLGIEEVIKIYI